VRPLGLLGDGLVINDGSWRRGVGLRRSARAFGDGDTELGEGERLSSRVIRHGGWMNWRFGGGGADRAQKLIVWARRCFCFLGRRLGKCGRATRSLGLGVDWSIGEWMVSLAYLGCAVLELVEECWTINQLRRRIGMKMAMDGDELAAW